MRDPSGNNTLLVVLEIAMLASGFAGGWVAERHVMLKRRPSSSSDQRNLGDAPQAVRLEVLKQLKSFQAGYRKRDPAQVNQFMNELFPRDRDIVLLGTDANEWITGYELISRFIYADWKLGLKGRSGIFAHGKLREIALAIETLLTGQAPDSDLPLPGDVPIEHR